MVSWSLSLYTQIVIYAPVCIIPPSLPKDDVFGVLFATSPPPQKQWSDTIDPIKLWTIPIKPTGLWHVPYWVKNAFEPGQFDGHIVAREVQYFIYHLARNLPPGISTVYVVTPVYFNGLRSYSNRSSWI